MRFKNIGLKIISLVLALAILAPLAVQSFTLTAFASVGDPNGDNDSHGGEGSVSVGEPSYNPGEDGVRLTVVDALTGEQKFGSIDYLRFTPRSGFWYFGMTFKTAYVKNNKSLTPKNGTTGYKYIIPTAPIPPIYGGSMEAIRSYFTDVNTVKNVAQNISSMYGTPLTFDELTGGNYKLFIEPIHQYSLGSTYYISTPTELALFDELKSGNIRATFRPFSHLNFPDALYLIKDDLGYKRKYVQLQSADYKPYYTNADIVDNLGLFIITYAEPPDSSVKIVHHVYNVNITLPQGTIFTTSSGQQIPLTDDNCRRLFNGQPIKDISGNTTTPPT